MHGCWFLLFLKQYNKTGNGKYYHKTAVLSGKYKFIYMKSTTLQSNRHHKLFILTACFFLAINLSFFQLKAQTSGWVVDSAINIIDGFLISLMQ